MTASTTDVRGDRRLWPLVIGALGVVFGDIGTSPLYTLRECMTAITRQTGQPPTPGDVLDVLSLVFWSLTMVVTVKYLAFIMLANNRGEGGIFALFAVLPERLRSSRNSAVTMTGLLVVFGAAFLYGDGAITPAISVLSAAEGLLVAAPALEPAVVPLTVAVLAGLFLIQRRGTHLLGQLFGPVMLVWFVTLAVLGVAQIIQQPSVLEALSPSHAVSYFQHHGLRGIAILGAVVLAVTGGEALYADMGHFGLSPIRRGWLFLVMPALIICYFGQGALLLREPHAIANPFFYMVPKGPMTIALVVLSSLATIIASQALITGAFSLTKQAMQLGFFPRVTIKHTSKDEKGQIYISEVNLALAIACILLVLVFQHSSKLAVAYGLAVTLTMTITSVVYFIVLVTTRRWPVWQAVPLLLLFLSIDLPFVIASLQKIENGGWVSLAMAAVIVFVMLVWRVGRRIVASVYSAKYPSFEDAWAVISKRIVVRTPGAAVFMASASQGVPHMLVHHVDRTRALAQTVVLLTVVTRDEPYVEQSERIEVEEIAQGFWRVREHFGYMEHPDVPAALRLAVARRLLAIDLDEATYYLSRERILGNPGGQMNVFLERCFGFLSRNAVNADRHFQIPYTQVIEVGAQIDL